MTGKAKVALAQDFLASLATLPAAVQGRVLRWALRFQSDPTANGIHYESIQGARDGNLKSVRIDQDWRGIVFQPPAGDVHVLMYVDHHDDAYRWAAGRRMAVNPTTGALQVFAVESLVEPALQQARLAAPRPAVEQQASSADGQPTPLFAALSDEDLLSIGRPVDLLAQVRSIRTDFELDAVQGLLPVEAYEGLFLIACGDSVSDVLVARETRVDRVVDTEDFASAIETAESQSRFVVVADEQTMAAMLNSPLAQWRVFLHPTQRKLAQGDRGGPVRVLGGAGTGKTVLAMHRAKWLAENRATPERKVLVTTFTRNLAVDIEENLKTFCSPAVMQRIEVRNLDAWVHDFLRRCRYDHQIIYSRRQRQAAEAWQRALVLQDSSLALAPGFYEDELEQVVLAQGISSRDDYRQARRTGRGIVLTRSKRDAIWPVFEEYRAQLASRKLKEVEDAYRDAAALLKDKPTAYSSVIVDETQDFGPQALRLLRAMVPAAPNDLLFVGDGHQRIYTRNRAAMSASGINIRGRSRKLYLNYRTTEEIRRFAVATLEGCQVDDLDEGSDEVRRYKSLSHGPLPMTLAFPHLDDALGGLLPLVRASLDEARSVCVIVPTRQDALAVQGTLKEGKVVTTILGPDQRDNPDSRAVRISTMHRAKGLEFDEVILLVPEDRRSLAASGEDLRRLQYVAMTRARKVVTLVRY